MPSAVVIINDAMRIIEYNAAFATMFAGSAAPAGSPPASASLEGVMLSEIMPFANLFQRVPQDRIQRRLRYHVRRQRCAGGFATGERLPGRRDAERDHAIREPVPRRAEEWRGHPRSGPPLPEDDSAQIG